MTEERTTRTDASVLRELTEFADLLFREVLTQRCDPDGFFHLPGLPVTNRELLASMVTDCPCPSATDRLQAAWDRLLRSALSEDGDNVRLTKLCHLYRPDPLWLLALTLCFACRLEPKYEKAVRMLQGDSGRTGVDPSLLRALAVYLGMDGADDPLSGEDRSMTELFESREDTQLFLRGNVAAWLRGRAGGLREDGFLLYPAGGEPSVIRVQEAEWVSAVARHHLEQPGEAPLVFELQGRPGAGKKRFSQDVAGRLGRQLCVIRSAPVLGRSRQEWPDLLSRFCFTCRVNGCIPYLELVNCPDGEPLDWIEAVIETFPLVFIGTAPDQDLTCRLSAATQKLSLDHLSMDDNLALWRQIGSRYPVAEAVEYEQLAGKYRLLPAMIAEVFTRAEQRRRARSMDRIDEALLLVCVRECNKRFENTLMERIHTVFRWEDLKVKPETVRAMQLACAHLKYRFAAQEYLGSRYPYGTGVSVLMYGPPGTGKTMAAQVIANELQMDLYRVDLSQISSKYIGETEKNLEKVFREAEQSNVILFFDEADSLFAKRTEVKDSNDKYANQETSYILQRIESYGGMVILATNLARSFDPAFMRRITVSIQFDLPDVETRLQMWKDLLQNTKLAENEATLRSLAEQFELSGSNIKSIVRNAVFMALMEGCPLSVRQIAMAVRIEFEKLGKIVTASSFGTFYGYIS